MRVIQDIGYRPTTFCKLGLTTTNVLILYACRRHQVLRGAVVLCLVGPRKARYCMGNDAVHLSYSSVG